MRRNHKAPERGLRRLGVHASSKEFCIPVSVVEIVKSFLYLLTPFIPCHMQALHTCVNAHLWVRQHTADIDVQLGCQLRELPVYPFFPFKHFIMLLANLFIQPFKAKLQWRLLGLWQGKLFMCISIY